MTDLNILFLCTGNSARSIMAEAILNHLGELDFRAFSAGSQPVGQVNPFAKAVLQNKGMWLENYYSKSWEQFSGANGPEMDHIITVCDNAAKETCPIWPGHPATAHWAFRDPAAFQGSDAEKAAEFEKVFNLIHSKISMMLMIPFSKLNAADVAACIAAIGESRVDEEAS